MASRQVTCLFVSHDLDDLQAMCDRIERIGSPQAHFPLSAS
jgi:ABC-type dipeptide/oligopeptide/nickel transport system ATPase subunit